MGDQSTVNGSCLCGGVTLSAAQVSENVGACHCGMCRKWGGGPLLATDCGQAVKIDGEELVTVFDSSDWADRGFCSKCGSHLFYRIKATQQYIVPAGVFADVSFTFDHEVFVDHKPDFYAFANETKGMTEAEVFAAFASSD
jgi:hypothetical protein